MIFLNIGSNLESTNGDRLFNLKKTLVLIELENIKILKKSSIYETPSYPNENNPKFLNIGRAALAPVSYLPSVLGLSKPI